MQATALLSWRQSRVSLPPHVAELDHIMLLCDPEAERAAGALRRLGLTEGSGNEHPGQGTACRRFFFENAYLELAWVRDPIEAQSALASPTRLWQRWSRRGSGAHPVGIALRASPGSDASPFEAWRYCPSYLPSGAAIEIARDTPLEEPELFYLGFQRGRARRGLEPTAHRIRASNLTQVDVGVPAGERSAAAARLESLGLVHFATRESPILALTFDHAVRGGRADLRPDVPLIVDW